MASLFDSDDEGSRTHAPSRAPAKQRIFKRPQVAPPTQASDAFPQLPLGGQQQQLSSQPPYPQIAYAAAPQPPVAPPHQMVPAPIPPSYAAPSADPNALAFQYQQPQQQPQQQQFPVQQSQAAQDPYGNQAAPAPYQPQPQPQPQQPAPMQQQPQQVPQQSEASYNVNPGPSAAQVPSETAPLQPQPTLSPSAQPQQQPPTDGAQLHLDPTRGNPMTNFLQQPLEPMSPPHHATHPQQQQQQHPPAAPYQDMFGSPNPLNPYANNAPPPGAQGPTASQTPAYGTASFASPRRSVSMKALPSIRMTHTPLGQVQLPSMPPVNLPQPAEFQPRQNDEMAAWGAFQDLRKQLEESHTRTLALHGEISRMQIAHEKEASNLHASVQLQLTQQSRELQEVTENYNSAAAKVDQLSGLLARKAEEIMRMEQKLHAAELQSVAMAQKVAHVEDRVKLADHARQVAEVRTRELELSLEHATTLIHSLRRQLSVANDDKSQALAEQYSTFETNRQQLIHFYAEREQFMLGSYTESLNSVQRSMQEYLAEREAVVEAKWEETYRTQLEHQQSLHTELVKRADGHVAEIAALKEAHAKELDKLNATLQREIRISDERWTERERNLIEDIARRERELSEREQRMRVNLAQAEQDVKIAMFSREAEMKAHFDRMLEETRHEFEKDRERLSTAYREQIGAMSAQHMANERELERLHREKEREMAQRYRISNWEQDEIRASDASTSATSKTQDVLLAKMDKMQADQEARRLAMKTRFSTTPSASGQGAAGAGTGA